MKLHPYFTLLKPNKRLILELELDAPFTVCSSKHQAYMFLFFTGSIYAAVASSHH
jgi:hypothetical protein